MVEKSPVLNSAQHNQEGVEQVTDQQAVVEAKFHPGNSFSLQRQVAHLEVKKEPTKNSWLFG